MPRGEEQKKRRESDSAQSDASSLLRWVATSLRIGTTFFCAEVSILLPGLLKEAQRGLPGPQRLLKEAQRGLPEPYYLGYMPPRTLLPGLYASQDLPICLSGTPPVGAPVPVHARYVHAR